jgi:hypothetical protein
MYDWQPCTTLSYFINDRLSVLKSSTMKYMTTKKITGYKSSSGKWIVLETKKIAQQCQSRYWVCLYDDWLLNKLLVLLYSIFVCLRVYVWFVRGQVSYWFCVSESCGLFINLSGRTRSPVMRNRSPSPTRGRSRSPAFADATFSAVQAALSKRQMQVSRHTHKHTGALA